MIIAVSDVHLAEHANDPGTKRDDDQFVSFLDYIRNNQLAQGGKLILLGDLVDYWRRDFVKALIDSENAITALMEMPKDIEIHYIIGNHDFYNLKLNGLLEDRFPFNKVRGWDRITVGNKNFLFLHGYQLEVLANPYYKSLSTYETFSEHLCLGGDDSGNAASTVWDLYQSSKSWLSGLTKLPENISGALSSMMDAPDKRLTGPHQAGTAIDSLASSAARPMYLGAGRDEFFIFGHTHEPFMDLANKVINTGSWNKAPCDAYSFLEIDDNGNPRLMEFFERSGTGSVMPLDPAHMKRRA